MGEYTTLLWDVDGTLLDFLYSQRAALSKCLLAFGLPVSEEIIQIYSEINDSFWKRLELGEVTKDELQVGRFISLFQRMNVRTVAPEEFLKMYQMELGNVYRYVENGFEVCQEISRQGRIRQYVVTNGVSYTQRHKLMLSGLDTFMEDIFISEEVGAPKPQRVFFRYVLEKVEERDPRRILLVGDSLSSDIKGGCQAGIATCWFRPDGSVNDSPYRPDYEITDLRQILDIL